MKKSIISDENKIQSNWMKFEKIGDKIEGTLIAKRVIFNQLSNKDQIVYEIKTPDNDYWNIGGKPGIDLQMKNVRLGQIVGFEFVEERKPSRPGYDPTKIIQVYANPDVVDEEWLQQQEEEAVIRGDNDEGNVDTDTVFSEKPKPAPTKDKPKPFTKDDLLAQIADLAKKKLGASDAADVKQKVMEATGLAFIDANLEKIIDALFELPEEES